MNRKILLAAAAALTMGIVCDAKKALPDVDILPRPQEVEVVPGTFKVKGAAVNCDSRIDDATARIIQEFANTLSEVTGKVSSFAAPSGLARSAQKGAVKGFAFLLDKGLGNEEYSINVEKNCVKVKANSYNGFLYAIQTLKQMMPVEVYLSKPAPDANWKMQCVNIKDAPRFAYRGMHLDCCRHFFSTDEVKKYLRVMAMYKLNRLHWHLNDDQGWRIEIKAYPDLTAVGGYRSGTCIGHDFDSSDGIRYGGYYTQDQAKEIVDYAAKLGITVIPEIDLPGHMLGALAAYPQLGCTGGPYSTWTRWGISKDVLCVGKESTMQFLETVLGELADLFPSEYFHIGGDECPKDRWKECPDCQAKIAELGLKDTENGTKEQYLQNYVTKRMQDFLATKGKKIIGWDEILEGELSEGATVMSWRGVKGGLKASAAGYDVIMTPNTYCYFDYNQTMKDDPLRSKEPLGIGGELPFDKVYSFNPTEGMDAKQASHILGVQANLWTEYIATPEHLEYMLLPRMFALSEVQWCAQDIKDLSRCRKSIKEHQIPVLEELGYNYRPME